MKGLLLALLGLLISASTYAFTTITQFNSDVIVQKDASLLVTETITVASDGTEIKHGILRDFPFKYQTPYGFPKEIQFKVLSASINDIAAPYTIEQLDRFTRVKIGQRDLILPEGNYNFKLTYYTTEQLGFFRDHDELYWNATGNFWEFLIGNASARVHLPPNATIAKTIAYTGIRGATLQNYSTTRSNSEVTFKTTVPLYPNEGMTVIVAWQKGMVAETTWLQRINKLVNAPSIKILLIGLGILLCYYFILRTVINLYKPTKGVIFPLFKPPEGFTAAELAYIADMGYSDRLLTAAIVNLASKGYLTIEKNKDEPFRLRKKAGKITLSTTEIELYEKLFSDSTNIVALEPINATRLKDSRLTFLKFLVSEFQERYFVANKKFYLMGAAATSLFLLAFFPATLYTLISIAILLAATSIFYPDAKLESNWLLNGLIYVFYILVACYLISLLKLISLELLHPNLIDLIYIAIIASFVAINLKIPKALKHLTVKGQALVDQVEGFKMFLNATEKERLQMTTAPDRTPDLFERYLPYAIAFGIEKNWSNQFVNIFAQETYQPSWYQGRSFGTMGVSYGFSNNMTTSLTSAIATSSVPGSSSGFGGGGGGGFSGGGGGGGGGGGW
jgi:uncharacterized membrane protein YgcG